jgi:two-component system chemotaxis response regulator CheB
MMADRLTSGTPAAPVIMFSSTTTEQAEITLQALRLGAVDFVAKPTGSLSENLRYLTTELIRKAKAIKDAKIQNGTETALLSSSLTPVSEEKRESRSLTFSFSGETPLVVIGCSTGGPRALEKIIPSLPSDFPGAVGIVQHMPEPFSEVFAKNLSQISPIKVKIADHRDAFRPGQVLMAPGDANLRVFRQGSEMVASVEKPTERQQGWMSSIDLFFCSAARASAGRTLAILLTGMGRDGADGMAAVKIMGGKTIAQDESSSAVFGMPRAAIERGSVDRVVPLGEIPLWINGIVRQKELR